MHRFFIVAPRLNYRYELFKVTHGVTVYPAVVGPAGPLAPEQTVREEVVFINWLKDLLNWDHVKRILGSLLAQAEA